MEDTSRNSRFLGLTPAQLALAILISGLAVYSAYIFYFKKKSVPPPSYKSGFRNMSPSPREGNKRTQFLYTNIFPNQGFLNFSGAEDHSKLLDMFESKEPRTDEGYGFLGDFAQLIQKLSAFKEDMTNEQYVVLNTRRQKFVTAEDIEPIGETAGRCFSKTISPRDLELSFEKWQVRAVVLLKELSAQYALSAEEVKKAEDLLNGFLRDTHDIARKSCLQGEPKIAGALGPRDPGYYTPDSLNELGEYTGYY